MTERFEKHGSGTRPGSSATSTLATAAPRASRCPRIRPFARGSPVPEPVGRTVTFGSAGSPPPGPVRARRDACPLSFCCCCLCCPALKAAARERPQSRSQFLAPPFSIRCRRTFYSPRFFVIIQLVLSRVQGWTRIIVSFTKFVNIEEFFL